MTGPRLRRRSNAPQDGGWTLIELLVVLSLIMILTAMAMTQYRNSVRQAREAALASNLFQMRDAIDQYYADKGKYPESLETLVSERYIRAIPQDPITRTTTSWQIEQADPEPGSLTAPGIWNVRSGASDTALDGRPYSEF
jgi:general secretion pathway protein G